MKVVFGVLAHERLDALESMIGNLRAMCPTADIRLFNGADDGGWCEGVSVPVSARSKRMSYTFLAEPHYAHMCDLVESGVEFDCLVVLDSDMLLIKAGFERMLEGLMVNFGYVGTDLVAAGIGNDQPARSLLNLWPYWSGVLGAATAYTVGNPGQVFRRDLVEHIVADTRVPELLELTANGGIPHAEEYLWPTYAVSRGFAATTNPGSHAIKFGHFSPAELVLKWADPNVFFIHKVSFDGEDRAKIFELAANGASPEEVREAAGVLAVAPLWYRSWRTRFKYQVKLLIGDVRDRARAVRLKA